MASSSSNARLILLAIAGTIASFLIGMAFAHFTAKGVNPAALADVDNSGGAETSGHDPQRLGELIARADELKYQGHKHLVEGDWEEAERCYDAASRTYEEVTAQAGEQAHEVKRQQVNEWLMDVRDRLHLEEMRKLRYGSSRGRPESKQAPKTPKAEGP